MSERGNTTVTWEGHPVASDDPRGAVVVVRRPGLEQPQYLLLHRAGRDDDSDWAWTPPSGVRRPGESVHAGVLRELAEEIGVSGREPALVDVGLESHGGRSWALFALDVESGFEPTLVDPEHDRWIWTHAPGARALVRPAWVADRQIGTVDDLETFDLDLRPMTAGDVDHVVRWLAQPHVAQWWPSQEPEHEVRQRYLRRVDGDDHVRVWLVTTGGFPVGFCQAYRMRDVPDYATKVGCLDGVGLDFAIGEPMLVGQGLGTQLVWQLCRDQLRQTYPDAPTFVASPSHRNHASRRVLRKCGFTEGVWFDAPSSTGAAADTEVAHTLDVVHWFGDVS